MSVEMKTMNVKCSGCRYEGSDFVESIDGMFMCPNCGADDVEPPDLTDDTESGEAAADDEDGG